MQNSYRHGWLVGFLTLSVCGSLGAQTPETEGNRVPKSDTASRSITERLRAMPGQVATTTRAAMGRLKWNGLRGENVGEPYDDIEIPLTSSGKTSEIGPPVPGQAVPLVPFGTVFQPRRRPQPTLDMGQPAPPLKVAKWLQGEPVKKFDAQRVYVVAFWSADDICRESLADLSELQTTFADQGLVVIAQHCWEDLSGPAQPFLRDLDRKVACRVALDDRRGTMYRTWVEATSDLGVPTAFVIDQQQHIAWFGPTQRLKATIVSSILEGTFSVEQAKRERAERREFSRVAQKYALNIDRLMKAHEWDKAERLAQQFERECPESFRFSARHLRFKIAAGKKDGPAVNRLARQLGDDVGMKGCLNDLVAYEMAVMTDIDGLDFSLAEQLARRELAECEGPDKAAVLDTLACLVFRQGRQGEAIAVQKEAVTLAEESERAAMKERLQAYEMGKLPDVTK